MGSDRADRLRELLAAKLSTGHALVAADLVHPFFLRIFDDVLALEEGPEWFGDGGKAPFVSCVARAAVVQGEVLNLATDTAETALAGSPSERRFSRWYATDAARRLAFERMALKPGS